MLQHRQQVLLVLTSSSVIPYKKIGIVARTQNVSDRLFCDTHFCTLELPSFIIMRVVIALNSKKALGKIKSCLSCVWPREVKQIESFDSTRNTDILTLFSL